MSNSLKSSLKSQTQKALRATFKMLGQSILVFFSWVVRLYSFFTFLVWACVLLWNFYAVLWIGEPIAVACHNVDFIRVDCTLNYRALIRKSEQQIRGVRGVKVERHLSSSESGNTTTYRVILQSQSGDRLIKEYPHQEVPEVQALQIRLQSFIENPEKRWALPLRYDPWIPILSFLVLLPFAFVSFACTLGLAIRFIQRSLEVFQKTS